MSAARVPTLQKMQHFTRYENRDTMQPAKSNEFLTFPVPGKFSKSLLIQIPALTRQIKTQFVQIKRLFPPFKQPLFKAAKRSATAAEDRGHVPQKSLRKPIACSIHALKHGLSDPRKD